MHVNSKKSKCVPYSITSVGHGAYPGFLAVSLPAGDISHKPGG